MSVAKSTYNSQRWHRVSVATSTQAPPSQPRRARDSPASRSATCRGCRPRGAPCCRSEQLASAPKVVDRLSTLSGVPHVSRVEHDVQAQVLLAHLREAPLGAQLRDHGLDLRQQALFLDLETGLEDATVSLGVKMPGFRKSRSDRITRTSSVMIAASSAVSTTRSCGGALPSRAARARPPRAPRFADASGSRCRSRGFSASSSYMSEPGAKGSAALSAKNAASSSSVAAGLAETGSSGRGRARPSPVPQARSARCGPRPGG